MNESKWNWKSTSSIFWGIVLVAAAVLLILDGVGVELGYGVSVWRIILGAACVAWFAGSIIKRRFTDLIFPLAFLFLIFEAPIAHALGKEDNNLISNWTVLLAALFLTIGLKFILPKKTGGVKISGKIGSATLYFDASDLSNVRITENVGATNAYIVNREAYTGGGMIYVSENVGAVTLHIPGDWAVTVNRHDSIGPINVPERPDGVYRYTIGVDVHDNVGPVNVVFEN